MKKLKVLVIGMLTLALLSCASAKKMDFSGYNAPEDAEERYIIPMKIVNGNVVVQMTINDKPCDFIFDSGYTYSLSSLYKDGYTRLLAGHIEENEALLYDYFVDHVGDFEKNDKKKDDYTEAELKKLFKKYRDGMYLQFTPNTVEFAGVKYDTKTAPVFTYCPNAVKGYRTYDSDGIMGFGFFRNAKRITINYVDHYVEVNGDVLEGDATPMYRNAMTGLYYVDVEIDGKKDFAFLDTGNNSMLRRTSEISVIDLTADELLKMYETVKVPRKLFTKKKINLKVCNQEFNKMDSYSANSFFGSTGHDSRILITMMNNLGYGVFAGKVIQFDMENSKFRMK